VLVNVGEKRSGLARAAGAPREAAASAADAASATSATSAASATAAATAATPSYLHATLGRFAVLLVEDVEGRKADVGDFLFAERNGMTRRQIRRLRLILIRGNGCRCTTYHGEGQSGGP